ncbi:MAG: hypothetical protein IPL52_02370 [Flavobacteriales bacterium]|nr:hypothetical protein [Flavobacteriales bacterium]
MQNAEPVQLRQVRDFGQLIGTTFTFLRQNLRLLWSAIGLGCIPFALVGGVLAGGAVGSLQNFRPDPSNPAGAFDSMLVTMLGIIPGMILFLLGYVVLVAVVHEFVRAYHLGEHAYLKPGQLIMRGFAQLGPYFGCSFLVGLLGFIGLLLCLIPGIYAWTVLSLALTCHAIERTGGAGSLGRSNQLVQGDFWATLGLVIVMGLINWVINMIVQVPFMIVGMVIGINSGLDAAQAGGDAFLPQWFGIFNTISTMVQWSFQMLTYPIVAVCMSLKYFSRVEEKEGHGLREKIAGFEQV